MFVLLCEGFQFGRYCWQIFTWPVPMMIASKLHCSQWVECSSELAFERDTHLKSPISIALLQPKLNLLR